MTGPAAVKVPFLDLRAQYAPIRGEIDEAIRRTLDDTAFILGPGVSAFESGFAPYAGRKHCVGVIPDDRRLMGLVVDMNVAENSILGRQWDRRFRGKGFAIAWLKVKDYASTLIKKFEIVVQSTYSPAKSMSGGNQQKVVVSRELTGDPEFILAAQPTRGLDIAASEYIRGLLLQSRDTAKGVLLISSDLDEVLQLSDTIGVLYEGRLIGAGPVEEMSREKVGLLMGGVRE